MRIGTLFGIAINVNLSWIFVFALVTWSLANSMGPLQSVPMSTAQRAVLGTLAALLFFASVLAHELAHSLVARSRGVPVASITLFIFGGVSSFEGEPGDAPGEAWISGIGPLVSLALGIAFLGLGVALRTGNALGLIFAYLGFANIALAIFNILPAYPLDGGRVLHALVWRTTRDRDRATRVAANVGRGIAGALIVFGIYETLAFGFGGGVWATFIGWFLLQAGNAERSRSAVQSALLGHLASELAAPGTERIAADAIGAAALQTMQQTKARVLPVMLGDQFIGLIAIESLLQVSEEELNRTYVTALMVRAENVETIDASTTANDAVQRMATSGAPALAVIGTGGELMGLFTRDSVLRWMAGAKAR